MTEISLACQCGKVQAKAQEVAPSVGNHLNCLCKDCRAYARYLQRDDILDNHGGTDLFQMAPGRLQFVAGKENIQCLRLSPRGLLRWHTRCCKTPIGNTMPSAKIPFVGIPLVFFKFQNDAHKEEIVGPIIERVWGRYALGGLPEGASDKASGKFMRRSLWLLAKAWLNPRWRKSPFFNEGGGPIVDPQLADRITLQEYYQS